MRILDTDVCIEILRGNEAVLRRRMATVDEVATTWMTACELHYGAEKSSRPESNRRLVAEFLRTIRILDHDLAASDWFGRLKARLEGSGRRIPDADVVIASTAVARGAVLVTGNGRHYDRIEEVRTEDWIRG